MRKLLYLPLAVFLYFIPVSAVFSQAVNAPIGGNIGQIVDFYNRYTNPVKSAERITIVRNSTRIVNMDINRLLRALIPNRMMGFFADQETTTLETFINGTGTRDTSQNINEFLPINGTPYMSRLSAGNVLSASCIMRDGSWVVTIRLNDEDFDTVFGSMQMGQGNNDDLSDEEREELMLGILSRSGYISTMDLGYNDMQGDDDQEEQENQNNSNMSSGRLEGGFRNGLITAVFNMDGELLSLSHYHEMNISFSVLFMRARINISSTREYQFMHL